MVYDETEQEHEGEEEDAEADPLAYIHSLGVLNDNLSKGTRGLLWLILLRSEVNARVRVVSCPSQAA